MGHNEEQYVIRGGRRLEGEVVIAGAKNAALGILAAAVMTDDKVTIENVPYVSDTRTLLKAIENIGATVEYKDRHTVVICGKGIRERQPVDDEYIRKIRASYYLIGALLGKHKYANVALPGGCDIGSRPIDLHLNSLRKLGINIEEESGFIKCKCDEIIGNEIHLDFPSVGATENIILASVFAKRRNNFNKCCNGTRNTRLTEFLK